VIWCYYKKGEEKMKKVEIFVSDLLAGRLLKWSKECGIEQDLGVAVTEVLFAALLDRHCNTEAFVLGEVEDFGLPCCTENYIGVDSDANGLTARKDGNYET
jgi:hypothetical protein